MNFEQFVTKNVSFQKLQFLYYFISTIDVRKRGKNFERILDGISMETRGGELVAIMATKRKFAVFLENTINLLQSNK